MSRYLSFTRTVTPAVMLVAIAGCGGGDAPAGGGGGGGGDAPAEMPFDVATAGNVSGSVMFEGTAPPPEVLDMASEADCAATYSGDPTVSWVNVGGGGGLQDVFVYVREGLEGMSFPTPSDAVVIDQRGCQYIPLVSGVQIGQTVTFRNSDGLLHNINASPTANRPFNVSQPVNMDTGREFAAEEVMVPMDSIPRANSGSGTVEPDSPLPTGSGGSTASPAGAQAPVYDVGAFVLVQLFFSFGNFYAVFHSV